MMWQPLEGIDDTPKIGANDDQVMWLPQEGGIDSTIGRGMDSTHCVRMAWLFTLVHAVPLNLFAVFAPLIIQDPCPHLTAFSRRHDDQMMWQPQEGIANTQDWRP